MLETRHTQILLQTATALDVGGTLLLLPTLVPLSVLLGDTDTSAVVEQQVERAYFGMHIPSLPDQSSSPDAVAQTDRERITEILEQQVRLISSLTKWGQGAFSLRYIWDPPQGQVEIAMVGQVTARPGLASPLAEGMAHDLEGLLRASGYDPQSVKDLSDLRALLDPLPSDAYLLEVRQAEDEVEMVMGRAYVVYPFRPQVSSWLSLFRVLTEQAERCLINVHLQPTYPFNVEQFEFARAAQIASSYADFTLERHTYQQRIADPLAGMVGRLYADSVKKLTDPLLLTVQIGSTNPMTAHSVAEAVAAELSERNSFGQSSVDDTLPSATQTVAPQCQEDGAAARQTLTTLVVHPWGQGEPSPGKERLPYLVDPATAVAAFRFPVPLRGGVPGIETRRATPGFEVGPRQSSAPPNSVVVGSFLTGGVASIPLAQFGKHGLIAGQSGSGKTTTCMHLLSSLWDRGIPFLVIEPAKTEYRTLLQSSLGDDLQVFTLGDEDISPFRLNPLEILPDVRVESHVAQLQACLVAALPSFGMLPALIEESLHRAYMEKGWKLSDRGKAGDTRRAPMLGDLYQRIIRVAEEKGYSERVLQDVRAAAAGRIGSLLRGGKGRMLNARTSTPFATLMTRPTVLELEPLNDEERALVMLFVMTFLREYVRTTRQQSALQHVTLIEEAHRVMAATPHAGDREVSADTRAEAAQLLSAAFSEIRAYGEGLLIAEQIPSRLAQDALKNTGLKIVHRLPGFDDRQAIGQAMNADPAQQDHLALLGSGQAALFIEGYTKPTFISVPNTRSQEKLPERVADAVVTSRMAQFHAAHTDQLPFNACTHCQTPCEYRDWITPLAYGIGAAQRFRQAVWHFEEKHAAGNVDEAWDILVGECRRSVQQVSLSTSPDAVYCYFAHLYEHNVGAGAADRLRRTVRESGSGSPLGD